MMFPIGFVPPHLRQFIALFAVAEGCLFLDIEWFVLFLWKVHKGTKYENLIS